VKVSKDRVNWVGLGDWFQSKSIFAMNSDILKNTDTQDRTGGSDYMAITGKQYIESRVINVSGQIIADDIYDCRAKQTEIKHLLRGNLLYFLDEYYNKVIRGSVPNVNDTMSRGEFDGRLALLNFNITALDPYFTELVKTVVSITHGNAVTVDYALDDAEPTEFTIKFKCITNNTVVQTPVPGRLELSSPVTMNNLDEMTFSWEGESFTATKKIAGVTSSILGLVVDYFYTKPLILTAGVNTFTIDPTIKNYLDVEISYYGRTL